MRRMTTQEAENLGIDAVHHEMDNGEKRFRLVSKTGSSYILTQSAGKPVWQNSHVHHEKKEFYVVEKGWILMALYDGKDLTFKKIHADESVFVPAGIQHNVMMSEDALLHTVKYGTVEEDWHACTHLDELLQCTDVSEYIL